MTYKINFANEADEDLRMIYDYIVKHFLSSDAAKNTLANIKSTISILMKTPEIGVDVSDRIGRLYSSKEVLRMLISGNYLVFYIFDGKYVTILRILYQRMNWIELFRK
jgi:toxin ParE1/3/4